MQFELQVGETGGFEPRSHKVETKSVNVNLSLMTPYGEPAPFCDFELRACFREDGTLAEEGGMSFCSDEQGQVLVALELLEPFVFSVKPSGSGSEYIPQDISFLTDRQSLTIVVVRSLLGKIAEDSVVFVVDTSGSMQAYLDDVTSAVNLALIQQFHKTGRRFNILTFTDYQVEFQDDLVDATPKNVEAAMQFCQHAQAGGISNLSAALRLAFAYKRAEAIYLYYRWGVGCNGRSFDASAGSVFEPPDEAATAHCRHQLCAGRRQKQGLAKAGTADFGMLSSTLPRAGHW